MPSTAQPWVALVGPEVEENLGLRQLASALNGAGFECEILPCNSGADVVRVLRRIASAATPPLAAALSLAFQWRALDMLALTLALREQGFRGHITAGGHFGTFASAELLRDFAELDSICRYEAEQTVVELCRALRDGQPLTQIAGLGLRDAAGQTMTTPSRPPAELAALAWPDRRGQPTQCLGHRISTLVGSRGCYARCSFCCIAAWHGLTEPAVRFRLRPVDDLADEMAWLYHRQQTEIFIFHDDNFFLPRRADSLARIHALADALAARRVGHIGTVVKARPNDVARDVFAAMQQRLGLTRVFLGVESDSPQGLTTLQRGVRQEHNHAAMRLLAELGIYVCFNLLLFDPDTSVAGLEHNLRFMAEHVDTPHNFGRVELYAGTPLLARMQAESRCRGDYLGSDYDLATPEMQRIFKLTMRCFGPRNFGDAALANRLMGTRFDVEVCRHFHPERYRTEWLAQARQLSRELTLDSISGLRAIVEFVQCEGPGADARQLVTGLVQRLRAVEADLRQRATELEQTLQTAVGARCRHARDGWADLEETGAHHGRSQAQASTTDRGAQVDVAG